jgi:hypothetical protein
MRWRIQRTIVPAASTYTVARMPMNTVTRSCSAGCTPHSTHAPEPELRTRWVSIESTESTAALVPSVGVEVKRIRLDRAALNRRTTG